MLGRKGQDESRKTSSLGLLGPMVPFIVMEKRGKGRFGAESRQTMRPISDMLKLRRLQNIQVEMSLGPLRAPWEIARWQSVWALEPADTGIQILALVTYRRQGLEFSFTPL